MTTPERLAVAQARVRLLARMLRPLWPEVSAALEASDPEDALDLVAVIEGGYPVQAAQDHPWPARKGPAS